MNAFLQWAAKEASRRLQRRSQTVNLLFLLPLALPVFIGGVVIVVVLLVVLVALGQNQGGCGTTVPVGTPSPQTRTAAQVVVYFESQGFSANGAAGAEGNIQQESQLNPHEPGGGLAQWVGSRYQPMLDWTAAHGYPATSPNPKIAMAGELMYIVWDLRTNYASLLAQLNASPTVNAAEVAFQQIYEGCGNCMQTQRQLYAAAAFSAAHTAGGVIQASIGIGQACVVGYGGYVNPLSQVIGLGPSRIDMGVDYSAAQPSPILAVGDGQIVNTTANGWPGNSFIEERLSGGQFAGRCWYAAEHILASVTVGQVVHAGDRIGTLLPGYPWSEFGWGTCQHGQTLAALLHEQASGDPGGWSSAAGASASRFLVALHAPAGVMQTGGPHGPLPNGYP